MTIKGDVTPAAPSADSTASTLSTNSVGSTMLNPDDGGFLVQLNVEFAPNKEHVEHVVEAMKVFHAGVQLEDPTAYIMPRLADTQKILPLLKSSNDTNYPSSEWMSLSKYCDVPNKYVLAQDPIDKKTLEARLLRGRMQREGSQVKDSKKKKLKSEKAAIKDLLLP